jgi:hypothetical protein
MSFGEWHISLFLLFLLFLQEIISHRDHVPRRNPGPTPVWRTKEQRGTPLFFRCFPLFLRNNSGFRSD